MEKWGKPSEEEQKREEEKFGTWETPAEGTAGEASTTHEKAAEGAWGKEAGKTQRSTKEKEYVLALA